MSTSSATCERNGYYTIKLCPNLSHLQQQKVTPGCTRWSVDRHELWPPKALLMEWYLYLKSIRRSKQKVKPSISMVKNAGLVDRWNLYWTRVLKASMHLGQIFKQLHKERVDQFRNLKQVTFKVPTKPCTTIRQRPINPVRIMQSKISYSEKCNSIYFSNQ